MTTAKGRYENLKSYRDPFLRRARDCALYTIPTLIPPEGASGATDYSTPYQSLGARGVNNLASKHVLALFPPNTPNFRLAIDDFTLTKLESRNGARAAVEEALNKVERAVMVDFETTPTRAPAFETIKHLLVAGNALVHLLPKGGFKMFSLERYVTKRGPSGEHLETVVCEALSPMEIPQKHRAFLLGEQESDKNGKPCSYEDTVELYTHVYRTDKDWKVYQEVNGKEVPGSRGAYPLDKCPWLPLRYVAISGEDYGRGFVEEHLGDLKSLEGLSKAIVQASAVASKVVFLVKPNSVASPKELAAKESGGFVVGLEGDVVPVTLDKYNDFKVALEMRSQLIEGLSFSFLLHSAVQRKGERVTAEEIRFVANELESAHGGVYSTLSQEFQLPVITYTMARMEKAGTLPKLPKGIVKPMISTGIEAIGRGNDRMRLQSMLATLQPLGPEAVAKWLNVGDFIKRVATAEGIDQNGLVRTLEEVMAADQQAQLALMAEKLGPNMVNKMGDMMRDQVAPTSSTPAA